MSHLSIIIAIFLSTGLTTIASGQEDVHIAIVNVRVLPFDSNRTLSNQCVLVHRDRIVALGLTGLVQIPEGSTIVDGQGMTLMPGLCDVHVHFRKAGEEALLEYLRTGITSVREMNGRPKLLEWRDRIRSGDLLGPDLFVACPTIGNWSSPRQGFPTPETEESARETVSAFARQGYDWIKFYSFVPRNAFFALVAEARRLEIPCGGHVPIDVTLAEALNAGVTSIEHLTGYVDAAMTSEARQLDEQDMRAVFHGAELDEELVEKAVAATVVSGVWNCPTIVYFDRILPTSMVQQAWNTPGLRTIGERNRRELVGRLHQSGAHLVLGTDSDAGDDLPASAIHDEMAALQEAGLSPYDILQLATVRAAEFLGQADEVGMVAVGMRADLLLIDGDPLDTLDCLREPVLVMTRGRIVISRD